MAMDIEEGFKKVEPNVKLQCPDSPKNECVEDINGICYYCHRNMLREKG